jgi:hypothetical protein
MEHHGCGRAVHLWKRPDNITRYGGGGLAQTGVASIVSVNRRSNLTSDRRPILTPLSDVFWR